MNARQLTRKSFDKYKVARKWRHKLHMAENCRYKALVLGFFMPSGLALYTVYVPTCRDLVIHILNTLCRYLHMYIQTFLVHLLLM